MIMGAFGGRLDQSLNSIHLLYKMNAKFSDALKETDIIMMSPNGMIRYLRPGENVITLSKTYDDKKGCGFFPIAQKVDHIQTEGLKYNMGNSEDHFKSLDFLEFVSTSNEILESQITVKLSHPVVFCTTLTSAKL